MQPWRGQSWLPWSSGLQSYLLLCFFHVRSQTPWSLHGHCIQGGPQSTHSQAVFLYLKDQGLAVHQSSITCVRKLCSPHCRNLLENACWQCCSSGNIRVAEVPRENQCLWSWGYFLLSTSSSSSIDLRGTLLTPKDMGLSRLLRESSYCFPQSNQYSKIPWSPPSSHFVSFFESLFC